MKNNSHPGATFDKSARRWKAQARLAGKLKSLGLFDTPEAAAAAVAAAKAALGDEHGLTKSEQAIVKHNKKKKYVYQSNDLLKAVLSNPHRHAFYEYRLFMCMLRCLHLRDKELGTIIVPVADFMPSATLETSYLNILREAMKSLLSRQLEFVGAVDGQSESVGFYAIVISLVYVHSKRAVIGKFNPDLMKHLVQLDKHYTRADVVAVLRLSTINSQRYYWLLKSWCGLYKGTPHTVSVEELRELTSGVGSYANFSDYRLKVMQPALEELKKQDFDVAYEEIVKQRTVTHIRFTVTEKNPAAPQPLSIFEVAEKTAVAVKAKPVVELSEFNSAYFVQLPERHKFRQYYNYFINKLRFPHATAAAILDFQIQPEVLMKRIEKTLLAIKEKPRTDERAYALSRFRTEFPQLKDRIQA